MLACLPCESVRSCRSSSTLTTRCCKTSIANTKLRGLHPALLRSSSLQHALSKHVALQAAIPVADGGDVGAAGYEAALDGLEALRAVLRDEHSLLTQYKMIVWGRVFTPVQVHFLFDCLCVDVQISIRKASARFRALKSPQQEAASLSE